MADNQYEEGARRAKVHHLIAHFESRGITSDQIRGADPEQLDRYAHSAGLGTRMPSSTTWRQVADTMDVAANSRAVLKDKDPFEGL